MNRNIYKNNEIMGDEIILKAETVEEKSRKKREKEHRLFRSPRK